MLDWLMQNAATIALCAALAAAVISCIVYLIRKKRRGCSDCGSCPLNNDCNKKADRKCQCHIRKYENT